MFDACVELNFLHLQIYRSRICDRRICDTNLCRSGALDEDILSFVLDLKRRKKRARHVETLDSYQDNLELLVWVMGEFKRPKHGAVGEQRSFVRRNG